MTSLLLAGTPTQLTTPWAALTQGINLASVAGCSPGLDTVTFAADYKLCITQCP